MARIRTRIDLDAPPAVVWRAIERVESHVEWMDDAIAIRLTSRRRQGAGTTFDCDTKVGPFRLTDRMTITQWKPRRSMGVSHVGIVSGTGRFTLRRRRGGRTRFGWDERLSFPWFLGGPVGAAVAAPILKRIWRRNLVNLKALVEHG
ncbi:MAG TPA: SRPBCC family protein [Acidimicrobiales bacterium]|nr:SRPBCC family protein [Acidimicrobiales bacterium]